MLRRGSPTVFFIGLLIACSGALRSCEAAGLNEFIRRYETLHLRATFTSETDEKVSSRFQFNAHGRDFDVHVETHTELFHPEFTLTVVGKGGKEVTEKVDGKGNVIGHVTGDEYSRVHGIVRDGLFDGVIHTKDETYHVEPLDRHLTEWDNTEHNTVIYRSSDVEYDLNHTACSSTQSPRLRYIQESGAHSRAYSYLDGTHSNLLRRKRADGDRNTCSVHVVADYQFYDGIGSRQTSKTLDEMSLHIADAGEIYRTTQFVGRGEELLGYGVSILSATVFTDGVNPLAGDYTVEELLEAFSEMNFDAFCLGHLFTYRDYQGTIGLAYLGDPDGQLAGGICQQRTRTAMGDLNLNTGYTSFLNFNRRLPRAVSLITVAHELGHNHGSPHDSTSECAPGGSQGNYIMFPSATDGTLPNNRQFSPCSRESIGRTIEVRGDCFIPRPTLQECGNGIVEGGEECDCGSSVPAECNMTDPCCVPGNCTLVEGALCSPEKYPCCNSTCSFREMAGKQCLLGGECQESSLCNGSSPVCPPAPKRQDRTPCNRDEETGQFSNVCLGGVCNGSICLAYGMSPCYCPLEEDLCEVCCLNNGKCVSTFNDSSVNGTYVPSGYPCRNFTGYCDENHKCIFIDNDTPLNDLRDILLGGLSSIGDWVKNNWYWVLAGFGGLAILIVLLQITYRRKKPKDKQPGQPGASQGEVRRLWRRRRQGGQSYGYYQTTEQPEVVETSMLLEQTRT